MKKYILIIRGEDHGEATIHVFSNQEDLEIQTLKSVFGEYSPPANHEMRKLIEIMREEGRSDFEADPSIEWLIAEIKTH